MSSKSKALVADRQVKAFADYLGGMSFKSMAAKYDVSERTVKGWSERGKWPAKRREAIQKAQQTAFAALSKIAAKNVKSLMSVASMGAELVEMRMRHIHHEVKTAHPDKQAEIFDQHAKTIAGLSELSLSLSKVHQKAMPNAGEEVSRLILEELRHLGTLGIYPGVELQQQDAGTTM